MDSCWKLVEAIVHWSAAALRGGEPSMHTMLPWVNITVTPIRVIIVVIWLNFKRVG